MHANVEDRGIKGECTPLMEAASAGHLDIVRLLVAHGADVNGQSTSGRFFTLLPHFEGLNFFDKQLFDGNIECNLLLSSLFKVSKKILHNFHNFVKINVEGYKAVPRNQRFFFTKIHFSMSKDLFLPPVAKNFLRQIFISRE